jgi:DNA-binding CsgD family transcriptional regulator
MIDIDDFSRAVAQIYDASLDIGRWGVALETLSTLFDSPMAQLVYFKSLYDPDAIFRFVGFDSEPLFEKYRALSPTDPRHPPKTFKPYHCRQLVSDDGLHSTAIYREVLEPVGIEYSLAVQINLDDGTICSLSVMRGPAQSAYTAEDCDDLGRFVPHVARATVMHGALRRARDTAVAARALIDGVPMGMIVLQQERIVVANAAASQLLDQGDALRRSGAVLVGATALDQARLSRAVREAMTGDGEPVGVTLLAGEEGQLRVVATRLAPGSAGMIGAEPDAVALYLTDSRRPIETNEEVVRRLFGLTAREAAVLCALVQGDATQEIAERLGIGVETVKTHLQHVMQNVGVNRQSDLVRLVLSSPAWIGDPRLGPPAPTTARRRKRLPSPPNG